MIIFRFSLLFSLFSLFLSAQQLDTSMVFMRSSPYTLNILQRSGKVYIGTSEGTFLIDGLKFIKVDDRPGYVKYDDELEVIQEIAFSSMLYIKGGTYLPEKFQGSNVQMVQNQSLLYVIASGALLIYELRPYDLKYPGLSIRSISKNIVATYRGIFRNGELDFPIGYSSGKVCEYGDTVVLCYDGLYVQTPDTSFLRVHSIDATYMSKGAKYGHAREYVQFEPGYKFLFTTIGVFKLDSLYDVEEVVFMEREAIRKVLDRGLQPHFVGETNGLLVFSYGNKLYRYNYLEKSYTDSLTLPGKIYAGTLTPKSFNCWISSSAGCFFVSEFTSFKKILDESNYHTLLMDRRGYGWLYCSSNYGLDAYDTRSGRLYGLIDDAEFNQYALHVKNEALMAGSVGGLYVMPLDLMERLMALNLEKRIANAESREEGYGIEALIVAGMAGILIYLLYLNFIRTKPPAPVEPSALEPMVDIRTRVIDYINNHIESASIQTICDHFNFSNTKLYAITKPEKPGELIRRLRAERVRQMRDAGYSKSEIADATGFSKSYVGRVK